MKKILFAILLLLFAAPAYSATWYAQHTGAVNINAVSSGTTSNVWYSTANGSGGAWLDWSTGPATNDVFEMNGKSNSVTVNVDPKGTAGATKVVLKNATASSGSFVITTGNVTVTADLNSANTDANIADLLAVSGGSPTILGNIQAGATTSKYALKISGTATTVTIGAVGSPVTINGSAVNNSAVYDSHTGGYTTYVYATINGGTASNGQGITFNSTGGTMAITGNLTGGSAGSTHGIAHSNSGATVTITGNCIGGPNTAAGGYAFGCYSSATGGSITITGDCQGSLTSSAPSAGCFSQVPGIVTYTGNNVSTANGNGIAGAVIWAPANTSGASVNYQKINKSGSAFYYMTPNPDVAVTDVRSGTGYGWDGSAQYSGTMSVSSGGGSWGF